MQERMQKPNEVKSTGFQAPNVEESLGAARRAVNKVRVIHGSNEQYLDLSGKTVGSIRKSLRDVFNIPGDADALVMGKQVGDDYIMDAGQTLEFSKEHGVKGA